MTKEVSKCPKPPNGESIASELPSPLQRSGKKAQDTYAQAYDSAIGEYGEGERANRVAYSALKHTHEKVGDRWEPKDEAGPSDKQAEGGKTTSAETAGGVDANASKDHLDGVAKRMDVPGRSKRSKDDLVKAIDKANRTQTRRARD